MNSRDGKRRAIAAKPMRPESNSHAAAGSGTAVSETSSSTAPTLSSLPVRLEKKILLMERYNDEAPVNVGWGEDLTIRELATMVARVVGYEGRLSFDATKPDGTPRKLLDVNRLQGLGWRPTIRLEEGLRQTYAWFLENQASLRS